VRTKQGLKLFRRLLNVTNELSENHQLIYSEKWDRKLRVIRKDLRKFNSRNNNPKFKAAFEHLEEAVDKMLLAAERKNMALVYEALQSLLDYGDSLPKDGDET
jgi:hypothetical protein